ncbi:MAG: NUDIX domain-containing protein [Calditrichaeota bacterium]|nr:NUDIX domain-containing protein [Calditrichota bacterium]
MSEQHMRDPLPANPRRASRIILIGPGRRVLYLRAQEPQSGKVFWVMPGGGLEGAETFEQAAIRELDEEVGCPFTLGPCVWIRRHRHLWNGRPADQVERFFVAHTETWVMNPASQDAYITDHKWWTLDQLKSSREEFAPRSVSELLPDVLKGHYPSEPLDCGV